MFKNLSEWTLSEKALFYATKLHMGQSRDSGEDYILHPIRVVGILKKHGVTDHNVLAGGFCHDLIEDCNVTKLDIALELTTTVADLVEELTCKDAGKFTTKHKNLLNHCKHMSSDAKTIKLADRLDNINDARQICNKKNSVWPIKRLLKYASNGIELYKAMGELNSIQYGLAIEIESIYSFIEVFAENSLLC